jgi:hypothetical protein
VLFSSGADTLKRCRRKLVEGWLEDLDHAVREAGHAEHDLANTWYFGWKLRNGASDGT